MRSSIATLRRPFAAERWPALALGIVSALAILPGSGCGEPQAPQFAASPAEADFERVTERLESALEDAQPAADSGVASLRTCRYRLIPPASPADPYTAEVTIRTTTKLVKPKFRPPPKRKPRGEPDDALLEDAEPVTSHDEIEALVEASETFREENFQLVYEKDRWKFLTEPDEPIARLVLDYALQY